MIKTPDNNAVILCPPYEHTINDTQFMLLGKTKKKVNQEEKGLYCVDVLQSERQQKKT